MIDDEADESSDAEGLTTDDDDDNDDDEGDVSHLLNSGSESESDYDHPESKTRFELEIEAEEAEEENSEEYVKSLDDRCRKEDKNNHKRKRARTMSELSIESTRQAPEADVSASITSITSSSSIPRPPCVSGGASSASTSSSSSSSSRKSTSSSKKPSSTSSSSSSSSKPSVKSATLETRIYQMGEKFKYKYPDVGLIEFIVIAHARDAIAPTEIDPKTQKLDYAWDAITNRHYHTCKQVDTDEEDKENNTPLHDVFLMSNELPPTIIRHNNAQSIEKKNKYFNDTKTEAINKNNLRPRGTLIECIVPNSLFRVWKSKHKKHGNPLQTQIGTKLETLAAQWIQHASEQSKADMIQFCSILKQLDESSSDLQDWVNQFEKQGQVMEWVKLYIALTPRLQTQIIKPSK